MQATEYQRDLSDGDESDSWPFGGESIRVARDERLTGLGDPEQRFAFPETRPRQKYSLHLEEPASDTANTYQRYAAAQNAAAHTASAGALGRVYVGGTAAEESTPLRTTRGARLRVRLQERPTYILDRGYQALFVLFVALVVTAGFKPRLLPMLVGLSLVSWGVMIYADATVRGKSVFDVRLAALAIFIGLGTLLMAVVGLLTT